jgi:molybdopterin synthase catalytic subunit
MRVRVLLFATLKEAVGASEVAWSGPAGSTLRDLVSDLGSRHPALAAHGRTVLLAVNHEFADPGTRLRDGDEVALMPPVSGGAGRPLVRVQREPIRPEAVLDAVRRDDAGAIVLFVGSVRSDPGVRALEYEAYEPMAVKALGAIADRARSTFGVLEVAIVHRRGRVPLGEDSVAVACSAAHRKEAFDACAWAMEEVKRAVPIWKGSAAPRSRPRGPRARRSV